MVANTFLRHFRRQVIFEVICIHANEVPNVEFNSISIDYILQNVSYKSYGRDSGNGSSEKDDSPRQ
jgi:hypothetical protein